MRRFPGPVGDASTLFPFIAEGAGIYLISVTNPGTQPVTYELLLEKIISLNDRFRPAAWNDPNPSPRIQALQKETASGKGTESFWKEVAERGTPLVEPFDESHRLVTFLWRAVHETQGVLLRGSVAVPGQSPGNAMHRIGDSDVWYLTLTLPKGARFTYQLVPNQVVPSPQGLQRIGQADLLNPKRWDCPEGSTKFRCQSIAELPDAVPQPWIIKQPGTPEGKIERHKITSMIQKRERDLTVYLPPDYRNDGPTNALLVLFDGDDYLDPDWHGQTTLDNLIAAHKIPKTVAVMIHNLPNRRLVDLVTNEEFSDFVATEVVPWAREHYRVTRDAASTVVGGCSAGGLASAYLAYRHSAVFGNVLSMSGAFWWSPAHSGKVCGPKCPQTGGQYTGPVLDATTEPILMAQLYLKSPKLPVRLYLAAGTFEVDRDGAGGGILENTRGLRDVLIAKGYKVIYQQYDGGHDDLVWRGAFADGLIALLGTR